MHTSELEFRWKEPQNWPAPLQRFSNTVLGDGFPVSCQLQTQLHRTQNKIELLSPTRGRTGKCLEETEAWAQVPHHFSAVSIFSLPKCKSVVPRPPPTALGTEQQIGASFLSATARTIPGEGSLLEPAMQSSVRAVLDYKRGDVLGKTTPTTQRCSGTHLLFPEEPRTWGHCSFPVGSASIQRQTTLSLLSQKHAGSNLDHLDHP